MPLDMEGMEYVFLMEQELLEFGIQFQRYRKSLHISMKLVMIFISIATFSSRRKSQKSNNLSNNLKKSLFLSQRKFFLEDCLSVKEGGRGEEGKKTVMVLKNME